MPAWEPIRGEQRVVHQRCRHPFGGIHAPARAQAVQVVHLRNLAAGFERVGEDVELAPARPPSPQDVEHFIRAPGVGIVAGQVLKQEADLVVQLVVDLVSELGIGAVSVDAAPVRQGIDVSGRTRGSCLLPNW